ETPTRSVPPVTWVSVSSGSVGIVSEHPATIATSTPTTAATTARRPGTRLATSTARSVRLGHATASRARLDATTARRLRPADRHPPTTTAGHHAGVVTGRRSSRRRCAAASALGLRGRLGRGSLGVRLGAEPHGCTDERGVLGLDVPTEELRHVQVVV